MIIIGITGTIGAGKGAVVDYLTKEKGMAHYSAREFIIEEVKKRKYPIDRDSMTLVANDLRRQYGPSIIAETLYKNAVAKGKDAVIESIRTLGEVSFLRQQPYFFLLGVDAPIDIRYDRIQRRGLETDGVTFEIFKAHDAREMNSTDPYEGNIHGCIALADAVVKNTGSLSELYVAVDRALSSRDAVKPKFRFPKGDLFS